MAGLEQVAVKHLFNNHADLHDTPAATEFEVLIVENGVAALTCFLFLASVSGFLDSRTPVHAVPVIFWWATAAAGGFGALIHFGLVRSKFLADASLVVPIMAMTPGFATFAAIILGEVPSTWGWCSIAILVTCGYLHVREGERWRSYLVPLIFWNYFRSTRVLRQEIVLERDPVSRAALVKKLNTMRGMRWAYTAALFGTVGLIAEGLMGRHGDVSLGTTVELLTYFSVFSLLRLFKAKTEREKERVLLPRAVRFRRYGHILIGIGMLKGLYFMAIITAFRLAPFAYIGSLKRLFIIFSAFFAFSLLGERTNIRRRIVLSILMAGGAAGLAFDPTQAHLIDSVDGYIKLFVGR